MEYEQTTDIQQTQEKVNIYQLSNVEDLKKYTNIIGKILFNTTKYTKKKHFKISSNGFIYYYNLNYLYKNRIESKLPINSEKVRQFVDDFCKSANKNLLIKQKKLGIQKDTTDVTSLPFYFPIEQMVFIDAQAVFCNDVGYMDHWLVRYKIQLNLTFTEKVVLYGAMMEFRVGKNGRIVGMNIRWLPMKRVTTTVLYDPPKHDDRDENHHDQHHDEETETRPVLVYVLENDNATQNLVAPYYLITEGHHQGLKPGSLYSLTTNLDQEHDSSGAKLTCLVEGGSGEYSYEWYRWSPETVFDAGLESINAGFETCKIPVGMHNVIVLVTDKKTGAKTQFEKTIYARGYDQDQAAQDFQQQEIQTENIPQNV